jgi:hypothetical protein
LDCLWSCFRSSRNMARTRMTSVFCDILFCCLPARGLGGVFRRFPRTRRLPFDVRERWTAAFKMHQKYIQLVCIGCESVFEESTSRWAHTIPFTSVLQLAWSFPASAEFSFSHRLLESKQITQDGAGKRVLSASLTKQIWS